MKGQLWTNADGERTGLYQTMRYRPNENTGNMYMDLKVLEHNGRFPKRLKQHLNDDGYILWVLSWRIKSKRRIRVYGSIVKDRGGFTVDDRYYP